MITKRRPTGVEVMQGGALLMAVGLLTMGIAGGEAVGQANLTGTGPALLTFAGCALFVIGGWIDRTGDRQRR